MNTDVMFVRVPTLTGTVLVPVNKVSLVQVSPNNHKQVVQDVPMVDVLDSLVQHNLTSFVRTDMTREEWSEHINARR